MKAKKIKNTTPPSPSYIGGGVSQDEGGIDQVRILTDNWKRALADYQNLVKRVEADKREFIKFAQMSLVSKLLPSLDILEMSANHSEDLGVKMAVKQFQDVLADEGLVEIMPRVGEIFDHTIHDCSEVIPGEPNNTIAEIVTKGYKIGDLVIRPAKVKVFKKDFHPEPVEGLD